MENSLKSVFTPLNYKGGKLCSQTRTVALDWIQVHCKLNVRKEFDEKGNSTLAEDVFSLPSKGKFLIEDTKKRSHHYKKIFSIYILQKGEKVEYAQIQALPHVSFIPWDSAVLKLNNRLLYYENYLPLLREILDDFSLTFVNYSRLDFASDFHSFSGGLSPVEFVNRIADGSFIFRGRKNQRFIASEGYELNRAGRCFNALKLGSRASDITIQLYNKTKELLKKSSKPWIVDFWKSNFLDPDKEVWRLEFSLKKSDKTLVDFETGEALANWKDINLISKENIHRLYTILYNQHFQVAYHEEGKQFCRLNPVELFRELKATSLLARISEKLISTSYVKYRIKKLLASAMEYKKYVRPRACALLDHVHDILVAHDLHEWFLKKYGKLNFYYA